MNTRTNTKPAAAKKSAVAKPDTTVRGEITLTKTAASAILAPYRETDNALAAKVMTLTAYVGKGHTGASIIRDVVNAAQTFGLTVPSGFGTSEVGRALTVARAMYAVTLPTEVTKSARVGIAAALMNIERCHADVGGGKGGLTVALELATAGTSNGAEIAERLTASAASMLAAHNDRRRALAAVSTPRVARPEGNTKSLTTGDDNPAETAPTAPAETTAPAPKPAEAPASGAVVSLADLPLARLLAEIDRRIVAGHVPTKAEQRKFDALAANWESALETVTA